MKVVEIITALTRGGAETLLINRLLHSQKNENISSSVIYIKHRCEFSKSELANLDIREASNFRRSINLLLSSNAVHLHLTHAVLFFWPICYILRKPVLITLHNNIFKNDFRDFLYFFLYRAIHTIDRNVHFIAISKNVSDFAKVRYVYDIDRIHTICNGIKFPPEGKYLRRMVDRKLNILFVGRLEYQKNPILFLQLAQRAKAAGLDHLNFILAGRGSEMAHLREFSSQNSLNIRFLGNTRNMSKLYNSCDLLVLPSRFEGFGLVVVEALFSGVPVLASNIEGPKELISDGYDGLLFQEGDIDSLWSKFQLMLANLGKHKTCVSDKHTSYLNFSIEKYSENIINLYKSLYREKHSSPNAII